MTSDTPVIERLPVTILTGFLGSGKSTLLANALRGTDMAETLALVNEIGEIGLDHDLVWTGGQAALLLENGCICCTIADDLRSMLADLYRQRLERKMPRFRRVVIETTGLADPGPVAAVLNTEGLVAERYFHAGTITLFDALTGPDRVVEYSEALAQVTLADLLIITKGDLASRAQMRIARACLTRLAPRVTQLDSICGELGSLDLFDTLRACPPPSEHGGHRHGPEISALTFSLAEVESLEKAHRCLAALPKPLLRVKGRLKAEGTWWLIQGVGGASVELTPYPGPMPKDATGALVVIGAALNRADLLAALKPLSD